METVAATGAWPPRLLSKPEATVESVRNRQHIKTSSGSSRLLVGFLLSTSLAYEIAQRQGHVGQGQERAKGGGWPMALNWRLASCHWPCCWIKTSVKIGRAHV